MISLEIDNGKYFTLFANCIIVEGANQNLICDLYLNRYFRINKFLTSILFYAREKKIGQIIEIYPLEYTSNIFDFFKTLIKDNFGFVTENIDCFPNINIFWDSPYKITNSIIEIDQDIHDIDLPDIFLQLDLLMCQSLQIKFVSNISKTHFENILSSLRYLSFCSIELMFPYNDNFSLKRNIEEIIDSNIKITSVCIFNYPHADSYIYKNVNVHYIPENLASEKYCGKISHSYFRSNIELFTESHQYNSCLNRKISIDIHGNIKNCPSMTHSFGNIRDTTLQQALDHPDFKKYWKVTKDQIAVCKDCEFRYICTDCRAYTENPEDMYSMPLKCGYNPYTCEWEEWSTNPLKQQAIDYYGMREVLPEFKAPTQ